MIYLYIYLAIATVVSLRLPFMIAEAREKQKLVEPSKIAAMTPGERKAYEFMVSATRAQLRTWQIIFVGLLWPTQVISYVFAHFFGNRVNKRADLVDRLRSPCPGCSRNLLAPDGPYLHDAIEDKQTGRTRIVCGVCNTISDWQFSENGSTFLGNVGVADMRDVPTRRN